MGVVLNNGDTVWEHEWFNQAKEDPLAHAAAAVGEPGAASTEMSRGGKVLTCLVILFGVAVLFGGILGIAMWTDGRHQQQAAVSSPLPTGSSAAPRGPQFEVVSTDWRWPKDPPTPYRQPSCPPGQQLGRDQYGQPFCCPPTANVCSPSPPLYLVIEPPGTAEAHGIFKNVGGRGQAVVVFYTTDGRLHEISCSVVTPETPPGGLSEASCPIDGMTKRMSILAPKVRISYR
jgi:hypothetical protein